MDRRSKGREGEELAKNTLIKQGHKILEWSFNTKLGEIDLITKKAGELYFFEVKARWSDYFGFPLEAVTAKKRKNFVKAVQIYLSKNGHQDVTCHLGAVGINLSSGDPKIEVIEDAFEME